MRMNSTMIIAIIVIVVALGYLVIKRRSRRM
ncbi:MAG: LPXTG cell wall anchor domain-containing protein [Acidobacteria bacterium]|nr:LPXTG cell wall anchor domain-containing protein [Acidobacteriota bacterium]